ncbi:hypothetical protein [Desulfosporosinus sp. I2]|nr:hypothetical protein [Desulfosporosinus sp. I2]
MDRLGIMGGGWGLSMDYANGNDISPDILKLWKPPRSGLVLSIF